MTRSCYARSLVLGCAATLASCNLGPASTQPTDIGLPHWYDLAEARLATVEERRLVVQYCGVYQQCLRSNGFPLTHVSSGFDPCVVQQIGCQEHLNRLAIKATYEHNRCREYYHLPTTTPDVAGFEQGPCANEFAMSQSAWSDYRRSLTPLQLQQHFGSFLR